MTLAFGIALSVSVGLILLIIVLRLIFARVRRGMEGRVLERIGSQRVIKHDRFANFFGLQSKGPGQMRGNGALVLTKKELFFLMALPKRETAIALESIAQVSLVKFHLGKSILRPLLKVEFNGPDGPDAAAWAMQDPEAWKQAIEKALENRA